jgi:hypothetical protein
MDKERAEASTFIPGTPIKEILHSKKMQLLM